VTTVQDDGWSDATHYAGGQPFEPPAVGTEPLTSFSTEWANRAEPAEPRWGATTYVGKPSWRDRRADRRRRTGAGRHAAPPQAIQHAAAATDGPNTAVVAQDSATPTATAAPQDTVPAATSEDTAPAPVDDERSDRGLVAAGGSMAVASLTSRVTGFVRSALLVAALGTGAVATAYNAGNNLPNMIYELLLGGVLSSVLIPLLVHAQSEDEDEGVAYTQRLLSIAALALGAITIVAVAAAPLIAAAFVPPGAQRSLTSIFATLLLPEIFFYGLGAMFMAVLNIRRVYKPGAWAPVLNNVIMIVTVLIFWALPGPATLNPSTITTPQVLVIGIGTTLGIAAQALVLVPSLRRSGFRWAWRFRARENELGRMREVGTLASWVFAYVVLSQIGVTVIQRVGIANGGFTIFTNADLLFQMPYGILVVSLLTAIMPRLSRAAVRGDRPAVLEDLSVAARLSAVALLPITAGLIALGPALTITLFAHGNTTVDGAQLIGTSLAWSAFGLFPFAIVMLQLRIFYAMRDGKTPTVINGFMVGVKVLLVLITNELFRAPPGTNVNLHPSTAAVEWLNISTSLSYVVGAIVGQVVLMRTLGHLGTRPVIRTVLQVGLASAVAGVAAYAIVVGADHLFSDPHVSAVTALVGGGILGLTVFAAVAWRMRIPEVQQLTDTVRHRS
jgi:putative peptidoglycan lipid II flippase